MIYEELGDTLVALVESVSTPPGSDLIITNVELEVPLEVYSGIEHGKLVFYGSPPHTIWKTGVLPVVHKGTLHVTLEEDDPAEPGGKGAHVGR